MMAYEHNNANNSPFFDFCDHLGPSNMEGKLTPSNNMMPVAGHMQHGFVCHTQQQQLNNMNDFQMGMNSQVNFNNGMVNSMSHMQPTPMSMNGYPQTSLMSSMMMNPRFQNAFQQPQQQSAGVPNFISFQNDSGAMNMMNPKLLPTSFEPAMVQNEVDTGKPLFANLEPLPVLERSEPLKLGTICTPSASISYNPNTITKSKRLLPADFQPVGNYVICGNKRKYFESQGNIRFREMCKLFLQEYIQAPTKIEKSGVVTKVMNILREDCPEGAFISPQGGRWYAVSERTAREKVGTFFRDCLADSYKSSAKNKIARRKIVKRASANNSARSAQDSYHADDGSLGSISFYDVDDLTPVPL